MKSLFLLIALFAATHASAALKAERIEYRHGDTVLEGHLAYDDSAKEKRPGVVVVHEWWGLNAFVRQKSDELARMGYTVLAIDMYGKGVTASDAKKAGELATPLKKDRNLMRERAKAGLEVLRKHPSVDPTRLAAIGFCFGGTTALELARSGADLKGVVSFHGNLDTPNLDDGKNIKAAVLVLHGADDPFVSKEEVLAFVEEMRRGNVDWQLNVYGNAVHSFTNPEAGGHGLKGAAYNEKAARRSWGAMKAFFNEIFK